MAEIYQIVKEALEDEEVSKSLVQHLLSEDVGVTKLEELREVEKDMLTGHVSNIKANKLTKTFAKINGESGESAARQRTLAASGSACSSTLFSDQSVSAFRPVQEVQEDRSFFKFRVPWSELPKVTLDNISQAELRKEKANPKDLSDLKLAIAKKLVTAYKSHKELYPGYQKYPGCKVYSSITDEVESKFGNCVKTTVKGVVIAGGMSNFFHAFEICGENLLRNEPGTSSFTKSKVVKGKKVIGVDPRAYNPIVVESNRPEQIGIKEHLRNLSSANINELDWVAIKQDLSKIYGLQREDIVLATEECRNQVQVEDEDDLELRSLSLEKLKVEWPFLFTPRGLEIHHQLLTKRDLGTKYASFMKEHLEVLLLYLTSCTKSSNVDNLIIRLRVEIACSDVSIGRKFLMMVEMLSNHFNKAHQFSSLIVPVERTVQPSAFQYTVLQKIEGPCVVAQDMNIYAAKKYFICADKVHLVEASSPDRALIGLLELCYTLDLEYPQLPLTFEFLERYVFEMGLLDTKVKRKGKQLVVISEQVKRFIEGFEAFVQDWKIRLPEYFIYRQNEEIEADF